MTLVEYSLRMEAYRLQEVRRKEGIALQAFLNQSVKAATGSKKNPKPLYSNFDKFFDTQKRIDEVRMEFEPDYQPRVKEEKKKNVSSVFAKRVAEFKKLKAQGKIVPLNQRRKEEK